MFSLTDIILSILWRLRPVLWLHAMIGRIIESGIKVFEDSFTLAWLHADKANCASMSAAIAAGELKLDELILMRACEILGVRHRPWRNPRHILLPVHSDRTPHDCYRRLARLAQRYADLDRLARLRAARMQRESEQSPCGFPLRLDAPHRSTSPALRAVEATHRRLASLSAQHWGRWQARPCAPDGRGRAFARGPPPHLPRNPAPRASQAPPARSHPHVQRISRTSSAPTAPPTLQHRLLCLSPARLGREGGVT